MSPEPQLALVTDARRYEALFLISEALSACGEPEKLAPIARADQLRSSRRPRLQGKFQRNRMARVGSPYQQIIQLALDARIDIVIMAVRGRGALNLAVFGSTT